MKLVIHIKTIETQYQNLGNIFFYWCNLSVHLYIYIFTPFFIYLYLTWESTCQTSQILYSMVHLEFNLLDSP
jgi:hypothetical protein